MKINKSLHTEDFKRALYNKITTDYYTFVPYEKINSFEIEVFPNYKPWSIRVMFYHSGGSINNFDYGEGGLLEQFKMKNFEIWYKEEIRKVKIKECMNYYN